MKLRSVSSLVIALGLSCPVVEAGVLTSARVTEIRNDVRYQPANATERAAQMSDLVRETDVLRTGERSLAELEFNDKTITRLGSLSVFSFNRETREFRSGKGTMLICVPKGAGGGRIVTSAITAAIQGTTVVTRETVVTGTNGQSRVLSTVIFLEGSGRVFRTGDTDHTGVPIGAGEMISQFVDVPGLAHVQHVDLQALLNHARILHGFTAPLPSLPIIQTVLNQQQTDLEQGNWQHGSTASTGSGGATTPPELQIPGGAGVQDAPQTQPASQASQSPSIIKESIGGGFYLSNLPIPGWISSQIAPGLYVDRKPGH